MFTRNRDRLLTTDMSRKVMAAILAHLEVAPLLSDDHVPVDGAPVKARASMKSFQPKPHAAPPDDEGPGDPTAPDTRSADRSEQPQPETDRMPRPNRQSRNAEVDFRGRKRQNGCHWNAIDGVDGSLSRHCATEPSTTIGIDLAKNVFQVHSVGADGADGADGAAVLKRKLRRSQVRAFFERLQPCLVGMEACAGAHYWARELARLGHEVRIMPPSYVKPYVKRGKTDQAHAEAICGEA